MSFVRQLDYCSYDLKKLGLRMNEFLYVDGDLRKNKKVRVEFSEDDIQKCVDELEAVRRLVWWMYRNNEDFVERRSY